MLVRYHHLSLNVRSGLSWHCSSSSSSHRAPEAAGCIQGAGDALYVPSEWGHETLNLEPSIGMAYEMVIDWAMPSYELPLNENAVAATYVSYHYVLARVVPIDSIGQGVRSMRV